MKVLCGGLLMTVAHPVGMLAVSIWRDLTWAQQNPGPDVLFLDVHMDYGPLRIVGLVVYNLLVGFVA